MTEQDILDRAADLIEDCGFDSALTSTRGPYNVYAAIEAAVMLLADEAPGSVLPTAKAARGELRRRLNVPSVIGWGIDREQDEIVAALRGETR